MLELWGIRSTFSLPSLPGSLWPGVAAPDWVLSMGQIELNYELMLNWITWNRTVFDIKTILIVNWIIWIRTVWLNWIAWNKNIFLQLNWVLMLNWIVQNRTVFDIETILIVNWIVWIRTLTKLNSF